MLKAGSGVTANAFPEGADSLKLVRFGWGHRKTVMAEYVLMMACGVSALIAQRLDPGGQAAVIIIWVIVYTCLIAFVHRLEARQGSDESAKTA